MVLKLLKNTIYYTLYVVIFFLMIRSGLSMALIHYKCRGGIYPRSSVERFPVPDDKVSWSVEYTEYKPHNYTSPSILGKPYADPDISDPLFTPEWNTIDKKVNRVSYTGEYKVLDGYPQNPVGRTGISGRGVLGRWGPNHAADPVVTRWKRLDSGEIDVDKSSRNPILQFVAIKRSDTGEWALPGGMVDPGEKVSQAAIREFQEEAINSLVMSEGDKKAWEEKFRKFFSDGNIVYQGYIDDRRNTDNCWMESIAYNFHDESGDTVGKLKLHAGDDAVGVQWVDIHADLKLYASHSDIVMEVLKQHLTVMTKT